MEHSFSVSGNTTNNIRDTADFINNYFLSKPGVSDSFFNLIDNIPFQTCEYWLKRIINEISFPITSSYGKRLLYKNGNPPIVSQDIEEILQVLSSNYDYSDDSQRRNGASLLRKIVCGESVTLSRKIQLSNHDRLFFLLSGLGYLFRNDRTHPEFISPFTSSSASIKTYAHCWFMFLLMYEIVFCLFDNLPSEILSEDVSQNFIKNNQAFIKLFGKHLNV